jgi:hypothetical protein
MGAAVMKRIDVAGFSAVGVLLASLALASSAVAAEYPVTALPQLGRCVLVGKLKGQWAGRNCSQLTPGKGSYEWNEGASKKKFEGISEALVPLETVGGKASGHAIVCSAATVSGEYTGAKTESVKLALIGCQRTSTKQSCQTNPTPGMGEGEIEASLSGELGFIKTGSIPTAGWDWKGWSVTATCGKLPEVISTDKIEGSVIGQVLKTGIMIGEQKIKFRQTAGKQIPERFAGEPTDVLMSEFTGSSKEQTSMAGTFVTESEEPLEIKVMCMERKLPCK